MDVDPGLPPPPSAGPRVGIVSWGSGVSKEQGLWSQKKRVGLDPSWAAHQHCDLKHVI